MLSRSIYFNRDLLSDLNVVLREIFFIDIEAYIVTNYDLTLLDNIISLSIKIYIQNKWINKWLVFAIL